MSGQITVGQFDFDDGGTYCGGSEGGKAHGFGVCTGPGGQGEYSGAWQFGFEVSGVYTWPNGNDFAGQWMQGKRHGLGMERRGHWIYRGEWTQGYMGRYGVRQSTVSKAKYEGTWTLGLHDGYGLETYSDGGKYQGQWMKGMRNGYGVRKSAVHNKAALCRSTKVRRSSLTSIRSEADLSENQEVPHHLGSPGHVLPSHSLSPSCIGFFLKGKCLEKSAERRGSFLSRQIPANGNNSKQQNINIADPQQKKVDEDEEGLVETYTGEWKNDKRSGFGVCERSDGLRYEGEWLDNCKNGYGITLFVDGTKEEGKYKNNVLLEPSKKMLLLSAKKIRERIDAAVAGALKAAQIALQKSDIASSRMESARSKAELAIEAVEKARHDFEKAKHQCKEVLQAEPNCSTKITKRLSIPRHNMLDVQADQIQNMHQQQRQQNFSASDHAQSAISQNSLQPQDQRPSNAHSSQQSSFRNTNQLQLSSVAESSLENINDNQQVALDRSSSMRQMSRTLDRHFDEPDYSQMNHVDSTSTKLTRKGSEQLLNSQKKQQTGSQSQLFQSQAASEEDHLAEIENIFSYLADEEKDMMEQSLNADAVDADNTEASHTSSLLARPSLRYRRDVRCPNLLINSQGSDRHEKPVKVKRRLTLPSIMKYGTVGPVFGRGRGVFIASTSKEQENKAVETIVIDNGVRKRLEEEKEYHPQPLPPDIDPVEEVLEPPKELPKRYKLESVRLTKKADLGSLPDVSMFKRLEGRAIPRQEAELLCQQKKQELQQLREIEDQLRKKAVVLKIGDFKEWCKRHELTIFLIAVNLMLAVMFSKLLSS